jgi:uncharacterized glyoxalase superfamily protein PhnB
MWISLTPELAVPDVAEAQLYYRDVIGFEIGWIAADGSYGAVYLDINEVFLRQSDVPKPGSVCCVRVDDVDAEYQARLDAGAEIAAPPETKPWAMREFSIEDIYGHVFRIGQSTLMT